MAKTKEDIVDKIDSGFQADKKYRSQFEPGWDEADRFYDGEQWPKGEKKPVKNFCFSIVEHEVPILTDAMPGTDFLAVDEERTDDVKMLEAAVHSVYESQKMVMKQPIAVREALKTTNSYLYVDYDPDLENGQGNVTIRNIPRDQVWIDSTTTLIDDAERVNLRFPTSMEELRRRFGPKADKIRPQNVSAEMGADKGSSIGEDHDVVYDNSNGSESSRYDGHDMVTLEETWLKDYSTMPIPESESVEEIEKEHEEFLQTLNPDVGKYENHDMHMTSHLQFREEYLNNFYIQAAISMNIEPSELDEELQEQLLESDPNAQVTMAMIDDHLSMHEAFQPQNPKGVKPKYDHNLRLIIKVGKVVLYDDSNPVGDGKFPLAVVYVYQGLGPYTTGELKNIIPIQKSYNEMDYFEIQNLRLNGNSGWMYTEDAVDPKNLTNEPGLKIPIKVGGEVKRLQPARTSEQFNTRKLNDRSEIDFVSGLNEATQGRRPTGITAAKAIERLQQQSIGRIRLKSRGLESYTMLNLGELVASRIVKYWTTERKLRVYDKNGQLKRVHFDPDKVQNLAYEAKAVPGSLAGLDKESIFAVNDRLHDKGVIDAKTLVEVTDIPGKDKILENIEANNEIQQTLQAQQEQIEALNEQLLALGVDTPPNAPAEGGQG